MRRELKEDLDRIVETIIYLMTESRRLSKDEAQRLGVTATQLTVLKLLDEIGDLSLSTLSTKIRAHNSTVTGIVDRMEAAGLVARTRSAEDRRVWIIQLQPEGRRVAERASVSPWDTLRAALEKMAPKEQEQLTALLKKVAERVQDEISGSDEIKVRSPKKENHGSRR